MIPWPAGDPPDVVGRTVADRLPDLLGQPVVIENQPGGTGGTTHLSGVLLEQLAGIELLHVPYKGAAPAIGALQPEGSPPREHAEKVRAEVARWEALAKTSGIRVD